MARPAIVNVARLAGRGLRSSRVAARYTIVSSSSTAAAAAAAAATAARASATTTTPGSFAGAARFLSTTPGQRGITPDDKPPQPKDAEPIKTVVSPANITDAEYHAAADEYLERLLGHLEQMQDQREDVDVEYSSGVLTVRFGPEVGTYVINKQPPNKQIWLSSPKTGPKRYDFVVLGDGQHEKQETACGEWMYLRDNSTMSQLFEEELGIDLRMPAGDYGE